MLTTHRALYLAYVALAVAVVIWDIVAGGRILRSRRIPRALEVATAFGALLLVPAITIAISDASLVYGRSTQPVAWVWPVVTLLFALQAALALGRTMTNPALGVPILAYDSIIAIVAVARFLNSRGVEPASFALVLSAAQSSALGVIAGPAALARASWLLVPMFAPAVPSFSRPRRAVAWILTAGVAAAAALVILEVPAAIDTVRSYSRFQRSVILERTDRPLLFGIRIFPELRGPPPRVAIDRDLELADTLAADAVLVLVDPEGARGRSLDSLARALDGVRGDSGTLVVVLGYPRAARERFRRSPDAYVAARLADVDRLARALRPTILLPADEPYGAGARAIGLQPPAFWSDYLTRAAAIAHSVNPNIRVGVAASSFGPRDSALYSWAAARGSPVDIAGFSLMPGFDGATSLDTRMRIAQRWLQSPERVRPAWVFSAGGYPIAHGVESQRLSVRGVIAWASAQPAVRGVIVTQAGDYEDQTGVRAPTGQLRPVFDELMRAIAIEREGTPAPP